MSGRTALKRTTPESVRAPAPVGREAEQRMLAEVVEAATARRGFVVAVSGEPGIGKSTLLAWAADLATGRGVRVLRATATDAVTPCGLLMQALATPSGERASTLRRPTVGSVPLDFVDHGVEPVQPHVDVLADRFEQEALGHPTIVVLDDLDRADVASRLGAVVLARRATLVGYSVIVAWRTPPATLDFTATTAAAIVGIAGHHLELQPLSSAAVAALVAKVAGALPTPALLDRLGAASGNPLLALHLAERTRRDGTGSELRSAHEMLVANVLDRLADDDVGTVEMLRVASAFEGGLDLAELAVSMRRTVSSLIDPLDRARTARVLEVEGETVRFAHELLREAIYESIEPPVRAALRLDIARALSAAGVTPRRVAPHLVAGLRSPDRDSVAVLEQAARDVLAEAPAVAADYLARAVALTPPNATRDRLAGEQARALCWSGQLAAAGAVADEILDRPHDRALDATLGFVALRDRCLAGRLDAAVGLAAVLAEPLAANPLLLAQLAKAQMYTGDLAAAEQRAARAVELSTSCGDDSALVLGCSVLAAIRSRQARFAEAFELSDRAVRLADASADGTLHHNHPNVFRVSILSWAGRDDAAAAALARAEEVAAHLGTATPLANVLRALLRFRRGDWNDVGAETGAEIEHADEFGARLGVSLAHALDGHVALHRGQPGRAAAALTRSASARAAASASIGGEWLALGQALVPLAAGDNGAAVDALTKLSDAAEAVGALAVVALVAPDLVRAALRAGRADVAARIAQRCSEIAARADHQLYDAIDLQCRGLLAADGEALADAAARLGSLGRPFDAARAAHDAAAALAQVDAGRARTMLRDAVAVYEAVDARLWLDHADADADRLGLALPPRRRRRPRSGWASLTATERLVVAAVADGLTNAEIGARLGISKRTVEAHLRSIFSKLGVTSRLALATVAARDRPDLSY
jgi:DNA-binding CsgD family transcriptional regulator